MNLSASNGGVQVDAISSICASPAFMEEPPLFSQQVFTQTVSCLQYTQHDSTSGKQPINLQACETVGENHASHVLTGRKLAPFSPEVPNLNVLQLHHFTDRILCLVSSNAVRVRVRPEDAWIYTRNQSIQSVGRMYKSDYPHWFHTICIILSPGGVLTMCPNYSAITFVSMGQIQSTDVKICAIKKIFHFKVLSTSNRDNTSVWATASQSLPVSWADAVQRYIRRSPAHTWIAQLCKWT